MTRADLLFSLMVSDVWLKSATNDSHGFLYESMQSPLKERTGETGETAADVDLEFIRSTNQGPNQGWFPL